jgi:AraC family transcriptional regulator
LAKIAVELTGALARRQAAGRPGETSPRVIARGDGWTVADVVCTCGPQDRPYEEQHGDNAIAIVESGSFEYRTSTGREVMTPGSLLLGNHGHSFECAHRHGAGDRCLSFWYAPELFDRLAADAGARAGDRHFRVGRVPRLPELSALIARAGVALRAPAGVPWEELAVTLATRTLGLAAGLSPSSRALPLNAEARLMRTIRAIDHGAAAPHTLGALARDAGFSPYHFLRTFKSVVGVTPHQYVLRARLRDAAFRLAAGDGTVLDVALDCGFGDVSNFNRAFRTEFGMSPRRLRGALKRT